MKLTSNQILKAVNLLNIPTNNEINGNWLGILCPLHHDKNFGNASVNLESGRTFCFSCKQGASVVDLLKSHFNIGFKEALELIDAHSINEINYIPQAKTKEKHQTNIDHDFTEITFDPNNYYYTRLRGFTKEFCKEFNITRCLSGIYDGYMIIPCQDSKKGIFEFEARKLFEYEFLNMLFNTVETDIKKLKLKFNKYVKANKIELKKYILFKDGKVIYDDKLKYLLTQKVRYAKNSQLYRTIWNIDNLNLDEELYLVEGIGSIPKIWTHISKNCSCTYGSNIDKEQIEILKKFKKIIVIPDFDLAGYEMIKTLHIELNNFIVKNILVDDTEKDYVKRIMYSRDMQSSNYLSKYYIKVQR